MMIGIALKSMMTMMMVTLTMIAMMMVMTTIMIKMIVMISPYAIFCISSYNLITYDDRG